MTEHLSSLVLDELAANLTVGDDARAHLASCADCQARLEALQAFSASVLRSAPARATLEKLSQKPARPAASPRRWLLAVPIAAAFIAVALFALPREDRARIKGNATIEVLRGGEPVMAAHPGELVQLAVGPHGRSHAAVFAVDAEGTITRVWPTDGAVAAPLRRGARVPLGVTFEVTPGDTRLIAFFVDLPVPLAALEGAVRAARNGPVNLDAAEVAETTLRVSP